MTEDAQIEMTNALNVFRTMRDKLGVMQIALESKKHKVRVNLYNQKEDGTRKLTEEQIRSLSMVECEAENVAMLKAQADFDNAKEALDIVKLIASN